MKRLLIKSVFLFIFAVFIIPKFAYADEQVVKPSGFSSIFHNLYCSFNWKKDSTCIDYRLNYSSQNNDSLEEEIYINSIKNDNGVTVLQVQALKGDKGDRGDPGQDGRDGLNGISGAKGDQGQIGVVGATGAKGDKGDRGDKGDTGSTGSGANYTAGNGLSLSVSEFALDLTNTNIWSGLQTFSSGLNLSGSSSNITLGSNYISGDGSDEGIFVDSSGNVGVGTSVPLARLDVAGLNGGSAGIYINNAVPSNTANILYNDNGSLKWGNLSLSGGSISGSGTINRLLKFTGATSAGDSLIYDNGVSVGIGTTSPGYSLDVNGNINFTGSLYQNGVAFSTGTSQWITSGSNMYYNTGYIGIGTTDPVADLQIGSGNVVGSFIPQLFLPMSATKNILIDGRTNQRLVDSGVMRFQHTPAIDDTRSITFDINTNAKSNTHAAVVDLTSDGLVIGQSAYAYQVNILDGTATGGNVYGMYVTRSGSGNTTSYGLRTDIGVNPIRQFVGTYGNVNYGEITASGDVTSSFNSADSDSTMFASNGDTVIVGGSSKFNSIRFNLSSVSSKNVTLTFQYSTGVGTWSSFTPADSTAGMQESGIISWNTVKIPSWAVGSGGYYLIRLTRNKAGLLTAPIEDTVQISNSTEYLWDSSGNLTVGSGYFAGNVGIGTTDPAGYNLYITGTGYLGGASAWVYGSDERIKNNIVYLSDEGINALGIINQLKPATFDYKNGAKNEAGFIAQDVQQILPGLVVTGSDGMLGLKTDDFIPYLVKGIQEQQKEIIDNTNKITTLDLKTQNIGTTADYNQAISDINQKIDSIQTKLNEWELDNAIAFKTNIEFQGPVILKAIVEFFDNVIFHNDIILEKQLCFKKSDGSDVCLDADKVEKIINTLPTETPTPTVSVEPTIEPTPTVESTSESTLSTTPIETQN